jgi:hypothetical protein
MYSCSRQASNGDERMHNVVVDRNTNKSDDYDYVHTRACVSSNYDDDDDDDDDDVTRACAPSNYDDDDDDDVVQRACAPSNYHDDSDNDVVQKACFSSSNPKQRLCAPSNYDDDDDIDNFCITDDSPFTSENVNTILKSFNDDEN